MKKIDKLLNEAIELLNKKECISGVVIAEDNESVHSYGYVKMNGERVHQGFSTSGELMEALKKLKMNNNVVIILDDIEEESVSTVAQTCVEHTKTMHKERKQETYISYTNEEKEFLERKEKLEKQKETKKENKEFTLKYDDPLKEALFKYD